MGQHVHVDRVAGRADLGRVGARMKEYTSPENERAIQPIDAI